MSIASPPKFLDLTEIIKLKYRNVKEFEVQARLTAAQAIKEHKIYTVWRIAKEMGDLGCEIEEMEDFIAASYNPFFIYKLAREVKVANISKLQNAIIRLGSLDYIARFACFIGGADVALLEDIIYESGNPKAAYIYLRFGKNPNLPKIKKILLKSKKPRYLYTLAHFTDSQEELDHIQDLIIGAHSNMYVRLFAYNIPNCDLKKLEDRILKTKDIEEIRKYVRLVKSERLEKLLFLV